MHRRTRFSTAWLFVVPLVLHGCAATPRDQPQAAAPDAAASPTVVEAVTPAPPPGVPMDISTTKAADEASLWTRVRAVGEMNLATGAQEVTVELQGSATVDGPIAILNRSPRWRVTEAIDQDGQALPLRQSVEESYDRPQPSQYAEAYMAALRGDARRRLPIQLQLPDLPARPRIIRKLTVVASVPAIRRVEERVLEAPAFGQPVPVSEGVTAVVSEPNPVQSGSYRRLEATIRVDPLAAGEDRPLIVGAGLIDAAGVAVDAGSVQSHGQVGSLTFTFDARQPLADPLRLRLIVATDVGQEQITCVARDIPVP